ncbi:MAG: carboxypeptidase-like regulatory domain-containing protein [Saprospiraceae bacterium]
MKKIILLMLAGVLAFASCKKDTIIVDPPSPPIDNTRNFVQVNTSVAGQVVDKDNTPISDALVSFGTETISTDENGIFTFEDVSVLENRAFVTVEKDGYFHGSRTFFAYANQRSNVKISLLEKTIQGTVGASGGTVSTPEGVQLNFPANAVANADGSPYTGTVQVAAQYLDPTAENIENIMPGDLRGITTDNVEEGLTTYGMVAVELLGSNDELLNVADGKTVQLTMPVGSAQLSSAPAEIPLWYFDETTGVWKEEGKATLQGDKYIGDVSHFTFWNCDINWDLIYLDGTVLLDGVILEGSNVCLSFDNGGWNSTACDYTNSAGVFSGQVPTNTIFTIEVYGPAGNCGTAAFYTAEIGPFTADVTLDVIDLDGSAINESTLNVTGSMVDCDNNTVTNGYAKITVGYYTFYSYTVDGTLDFTFIHCGTLTDDVEVTFYDINGATKSELSTYPMSGNIDVGEVQACITLDEYIIYEYGGVNYTMIEYIGIYDTLGAPTQHISGSSGNQVYTNISIDGTAVGTFSGGTISIWANQVSLYGDDIEVTFTQYSGVSGEVCQGTFSGELTDPTGAVSPITGSFKAIRD